MISLLLIGLTFILILPNQLSNGQDSKPVITHGIASGDVTNESAIIWSKSNKESTMNVQYSNTSNFEEPTANDMSNSIVNSSSDYIGHIKLKGLDSNSTYFYRVWFSDNLDPSIVSEKAIGKFKTSPDPNENVNIDFIIAGDLGGTTLCRQVGIGYPIFTIMNSTNPDFFIFNGDQIYADGTCDKTIRLVSADYPYWNNIFGNFKRVNEVNWTNQEELDKTFLKHWEYNREDPHLQGFLKHTSLYSQADDHEVIDNYGNWSTYAVSKVESERTKPGFPNLVKTGTDYFFKFSPIDRNVSEPYQIYRMFNWGNSMDLFLLDAHSYRSINTLEDNSTNNKTLYGKQQIEWLKNKLISSNSTWKVISNPIPVTIPDCYGYQKACNSWATNSTTNKLTFTKERADFLKFLDKNDIKNVVFITTDVHFAGTVKVKQDFDADGEVYEFYEMANGPLSVYTNDKPNPVDPTINAAYQYSESALFNFGHIKIEKGKDGNYDFIYEVIDSNGRIRPGSELTIHSEK